MCWLVRNKLTQKSVSKTFLSKVVCGIYSESCVCSPVIHISVRDLMPVIVITLLMMTVTLK